MPIAQSFDVGSRSDPGRQRRDNEDQVFADPPSHPSIVAARGSLFAVADGMGEHLSGALAADRAIAKVKEEYYFGDQSLDVTAALRRAIVAANSAVYELGRSDPSRFGMGTTFVTAVVHDDRVVVGWIGDSRAYIVSPDKVRLVTTDQRLVQSLTLPPTETDPGQGLSRPRRVVVSALGIEPSVEPDVLDLPRLPEETIVLCSDGLTNHVGDEEVRAIATRLGPQLAADELVRLANERGGSDNIAIVVVGPPRMASAPRLASGTALASPDRPRRIPRFLPEVVALLVLVAIVGAFAAYRLDAANAPTPPASAMDPRSTLATATPAIDSIPASDSLSLGHEPTATLDLAALIETAGPTDTVEATAIVGVPTAVAAEAVVSAPTTADTVPPAATATAAAPSATSSPLPTASPQPPSPTSLPTTVRGATSSYPSSASSIYTSRSAPIKSASATVTPTAQTALILNPAVNTSGQVILSWSYGGTLTSDEAFDVRVWGSNGGDPSAGIANVGSGERSYVIGSGFIYGPGTYSWTIAIIRTSGGATKTVEVAAGAPLQFTWQPSSSSTSNPSVRPP
jgi:protein phosphatase